MKTKHDYLWMIRPVWESVPLTVKRQKLIALVIKVKDAAESLEQLTRREQAARFRLLNPFRYRSIMLTYYYRNRARINLMFSRPTGREDDEADKWLNKRYSLG